MPRPPTYPLVPLREHRDRNVDGAAADLDKALRAREAAANVKSEAERVRHAAEARAALLRAEEEARFARGDLCASDLARAAAWEQGEKSQLADLAGDVQRAERALADASAAEGAARAALARRKSELDVVKKDEARFEDRSRRAHELAEDEEAGEVFAARRRNE